MAKATTAPEALGLYLSVPFCRSKCTFCNFASGVYPATDLPRYVARLIEDMAGARRQAEGEQLWLPEQVDTVYFGGGTPSILSPAQLTSIFAAMGRHFELRPGAEITLEAAPAMLPDECLAAAIECGVTRISFGVQTFVDAEARGVGRLHTAAQALEDVRRAKRAGLAVSVDLIAGLPGQTEASWRHSLAVLGEAAPEHASIYMLEVDQDSRLGEEMLLGGTRYGAGLTPSDDAVADFYTEACSVLAAQGLAQYEISNFAQPGRESRHNLRYWQRRPYLGLGLDAHSMLHTLAWNCPDVGPTERSLPAPNHLYAPGRGTPANTARFGTTDDLATYLDDRQPQREVNRITRAEALEEAWFLGLRINAGISLAAMRTEFGHAAAETFTPMLARLSDEELVTLEDGRVALTHRGRLFSNEVFARFLDVAETCPEPAESSVLAAEAR